METTVITYLSNTINIVPPTPILPNNVIFDQGVFNMTRMKPGFDLNNIITAKEINPRVNYASGGIIITSDTNPYTQQDVGVTFVNQGTDENVLTIENQKLKHVGKENTNSNIDGCDYYFPINFGSANQEGYTKVLVDLEYSTEGIQNPTGNTRRIIFNAATTTQNYQIRNIAHRNYNFTLNDTPTLTEHILEGDFSPLYVDSKITYFTIIMTHGTYLIKKIWFE